MFLSLLFLGSSEKLYFPYFCEKRAIKLQAMTNIPPNYKNHGPKNDNQKNCKFADCKKLRFSWGIDVTFLSFRHFGTTRSKKKTDILKFIRKRQKNDKEMTMLRDMYDIFATCKIVMCCHLLFLFIIWWKCCYLFVFFGAVFVQILKNITN